MPCWFPPLLLRNVPALAVVSVLVVHVLSQRCLVLLQVVVMLLALQFGSADLVLLCLLYYLRHFPFEAWLRTPLLVLCLYLVFVGHFNLVGLFPAVSGVARSSVCAHVL